MNPFVVLTTFVALASAFSVNTPASPVVCQPLQITWSPDGASSPFYLSVVPAGQPNADALKQFPAQQGSSFTWPKVDLPPGTGFTVALKDASGQQAYSAPTTVQKGSDTSCVNNDAMEGSSASSPDQTTSVPTKGYPGVAAASQSSAPSTSTPAGAAAAGSKSTSSASMPGPSSSKMEMPKMSGSSVSSRQSPSAKANSAGRSTPWTVFGIMSAVGLTSIVISVVV